MEDNRKQLALTWVACFALALALYAGTCSRGSCWQDSGLYQYRIWNNDIKGGYGLATSHPLYHIVGIAVKHLPFGSFGYRVNLISAFFGALTVANVWLLLRLWLGRLTPALVGSLTLALSWTFWQHCAIAEVYTMYAFLFTLELIFLLCCFQTGQNCYLYLLAASNGLAISVHVWAVIPLFCYTAVLVALLIKRKISLAVAAGVAFCWMCGAAVYEYLVIGELLQTGQFLNTFKQVFFGTPFNRQVLNVSLTLPIVAQNIAFILYNFATPNILAAAAGFWMPGRNVPYRTFRLLLVVIAVLFLVFAFRYNVPDRYVFFIPFYCLASILTGLGAHRFFEKYSAATWKAVLVVSALLVVPVYAVTPTLAQRYGIKIPTKRTIPYRNDYTHFLRPWRASDNSAQLFAEDALGSAGPGATIIADGTVVFALWYRQEVEGHGQAVRVFALHLGYKNPGLLPTQHDVETLVRKGQLYVVTPTVWYCPKFIVDNYDFVQKGALYQVVPRQ